MKYYGKHTFIQGKTWHVIYASSMKEAKRKMLKGTRLTEKDIKVQTKRPRGNVWIVGDKGRHR